jgi:pimeloyl-ACP methyl ester carboxylesterase
MLKPGNFITYKKSLLHYAIGGNGPLPLFLFHGFGQDHSVFEEWIGPLGEKFKLYSFDLFFHGESRWNVGEPLEIMDWKEILTAFLTKEKIDHFAVAGYSLGGRFALATIASFPQMIEEIFLLAPDGVRTSFWYNLATWPFLTRSLFKTMIARPGRFQDIVRFLRTAGLVHNGVLRFAESQMDTEDKRRRVYNTWVYFRHLRSDIKKIAEIINQQKIPMTILLGRFDKMIPAKKINTLLTRVACKQVEILDAGHNDLIHVSSPFLLSHKNHASNSDIQRTDKSE